MLPVATQNAEQEISHLFGKLRIKLAEYVPVTTEERKKQIAQFVTGLLHVIHTGVCHGDIKPANILWDKKKELFDLADFGGSILIQEQVKKMHALFTFASEEDKTRMSTLAAAFASGNKLEEAIKRWPERVAKLEEWGIVKRKEIKTGKLIKRTEYGPHEVVNPKALEELRAYLKTQFLPAKSDGYASDIYTQAMCNYFWRAEPENFKNACHAFDMRAAGLTIYIIFTAAHPPRGKDDCPAYYEGLDNQLRALKISKTAISIIHRMAEHKAQPLDAPFQLPVSLDELEQLKAEMAG